MSQIMREVSLSHDCPPILRFARIKDYHINRVLFRKPDSLGQEMEASRSIRILILVNPTVVYFYNLDLDIDGNNSS